MKVLVIASADATNLSIENVIRQFMYRGHKVDVYAQFMDYKTIRMFLEMGLEVEYAAKLNSKKIKTYDIAFCGTDAMHLLRWENIYVFNYNFIFINQWPSDASDFMFTICNKRDMRYYEDCAKMPIGVPKNDTPIIESCKKQFLYIDAGHVPFGKIGKSQVAEMLIKICNYFPDYKVVIKPRWLLSDKENITHINKNHIYHVIEELTEGNLPPNLVMLEQHIDLQKLIDESETVITTSYSTYLDVALRGKGVIVVGEIECGDQYEIRSNVTLHEQNEVVKKAGCLVSYKEILNYLPKGIKCEENYLTEMLPYKSKVSEKIVDVIEWIYENYLKKGCFPKIVDYNYETYRDTMSVDTELDFNVLKRKRLKNAILKATRRFDWIDAKVDYGRCYKWLEEYCQTAELSNFGFDKGVQLIEQMRKEILIENRDELLDNDLNQAALFQAYYDLGKYDDVIKFQEEYIKGTIAYYFYMGLIQKKRKHTESSLYYLGKYFEEVNKSSYEKYFQETRKCYIEASNALIDQYDGYNVAAELMFDFWAVCKENNKDKWLSSARRKKISKLIPLIGEALYSEGKTDKAARCMFWLMKEIYINNKQIENKKISLLPSTVEGAVWCIKNKGWQYTIEKSCRELRKKLRKG